MNVVSGTGSISYGEHDGRHVRVGGWGELFGDEGSAYWLAIRGLQAWTRMTDGRAPVGPLHGILGERLRLDAPLDLVSLVHETWQGDRRTIAALAPLVVQAAEQGDPVAGGIVAEAVAELVPWSGSRPTGWGSSPARSCRSPARAACSGRRPSATPSPRRSTSSGAYELRPSRFSPVVGAALYAAREVGAPLTPDALERLEASSPSRSDDVGQERGSAGTMRSGRLE